MNIRNATLKDKKGVARVLKESYNISSIEEAEEVFETELKKKINYIIAEEDSQILGIVTWMIHDLPKHQLAELHRIAVLPDFRGKGVSRGLFNEMLVLINKFYKKNNSKLRKLYLLTHNSNIRAQTFYKKLGFEHETTLKNHYYDGEDELVFSMFFKE